jgi:hypothetical protein
MHKKIALKPQNQMDRAPQIHVPLCPYILGSNAWCFRFLSGMRRLSGPTFPSTQCRQRFNQDHKKIEVRTP